jgi:hypothetical protein
MRSVERAGGVNQGAVANFDALPVELEMVRPAERRNGV